MNSISPISPASPTSTASTTFAVGGDLTVRRIGYGAMRIVGQPGNFGPPADRNRSIAVLRAAVDAGTDFIDTAEAYGPGVSEELIADALHPYPEGLVIATKGGVAKAAPDDIRADGSPAALRRSVHASLRRLRLDRLDLYQLHRPDPAVPLTESVHALAELQDEGLIRHIGLSNVTATQLRAAQRVATIATVQNRFGLRDRGDDPLVDLLAEEGVAYLPYGPLGAHPMRPGAPVAIDADAALEAIAARHGATTAQIALAWLLHRSPNVIPIPGTTDPNHARENAAAQSLQLTDDDIEALS